MNTSQKGSQEILERVSHMAMRASRGMQRSRNKNKTGHKICGYLLEMLSFEEQLLMRSRFAVDVDAVNKEVSSILESDKSKQTLSQLSTCISVGEGDKTADGKSCNNVLTEQYMFMF